MIHVELRAGTQADIRLDALIRRSKGVHAVPDRPHAQLMVVRVAVTTSCGMRGANVAGALTN
jgi:hypothetical protein